MSAHPFDQLLGTSRRRLPTPTDSTVVISGRSLSSASNLPTDEDADDAAAARRELQRAKDRARYQRDRQDPEKMARRKASYEANREKLLAYKREYDAKNVERVRAAKAAYQRRDRLAHPEKHSVRQREYYYRNQEAILARAQARRDAKKAAKAAANPIPTTA